MEDGNGNENKRGERARSGTVRARVVRWARARARANLEGRQGARDDVAEHAASTSRWVPCSLRGVSGGARGRGEARPRLRCGCCSPEALGGGERAEMGEEHGKAPLRSRRARRRRHPWAPAGAGFGVRARRRGRGRGQKARWEMRRD
jgi:hypothetical protein